MLKHLRVDTCPHCFAPGQWGFGKIIFYEISEEQEFVRHDCVQYLQRRLREEQDKSSRLTSEFINAIRALPTDLQNYTTLADAIRALRKRETSTFVGSGETAKEG